jgi:hypothetical protein
MITLFEKLQALPPALSTPQQRAAWAEFASLRMPLLPLEPDGTIAPARVLSTGGKRNSEGPELFAMHPHRVFTKGRQVATGLDISTAVATYKASAWATYSNVGWNYALNAAVLTGLTEAAVPQLLARATTEPAPGYRFPGFSPQFQDYDPSGDRECVGGLLGGVPLLAGRLFSFSFSRLLTVYTLTPPPFRLR